MDPEAHERACAVFLEALDQPSEAREAYIAAACGDDAALSAAVTMLYEGHRNASHDGFLELPAFVVDQLPLSLPDFGDYEGIEYIGHGGMGVVYRARQKSLGRTVALKMSLPRHLLTPEDLARFRAEARNMARLRHPNIVRVYDIEEQEGRPYFRMELIEGDTLDRLARSRDHDPRAIVAMVATLARAMHYAHQRGVLHRDLKPANILVEVDGTPYISDFGLARRFGDALTVEEDGLRLGAEGRKLARGSGAYRGIVGTAGFMSAEQADPLREETVRSDVYGLGAVLYALLTGRPPHLEPSLEETLHSARNPEVLPAAPRTLNPAVDADLEAVCLKCLDKDPERRYASAAELADDLERWLHGLETRARRWHPLLRGARWCGRRPVATALLAIMVVTLLLAGFLWSTAASRRRLQARHQAQIAARHDELLASTGHVARLVASTVRARLDELERSVEQESRRPELALMLAEADRGGLELLVEQIAGRHTGADPGSAYEAWAVFDTDGTMLAHSLDSTLVGTRFDYRDYFQGALELYAPPAPPRAHVSRAYLSRAQGIFKFGIACAIPHPKDVERPAGVLLASITTDRTLGLPHTIDSRYVPVLVAPSETPAGSSGGGEQGYAILFHPAYAHGVEPEAFPEELFARLGQATLLDDYRDPVGARDPSYAGRWLAGTAEVAGTEFRVVVQARDAVSSDDSA